MKNYKTKEKKQHFLLKLILMILIVFVIATTSIVLYDMYINIEVYEDLYTAQKTSQLISPQEIEKKDISTILEEVSKSVVRYIKN